MYIYRRSQEKSNEIHDPCDDAGIVGDDRVRWSVPAQGKLEYLWLLGLDHISNLHEGKGYTVEGNK
jgi:hypothetical protein